MRLPARPGERLDRNREVTFSFYGKPVRAFEGDTFGSALYASGQRIFSRSFKYHRPRGLLCCSGSCANCMMTVDGVPNVRICAEPVREGAVVRPQNVLGSLEHDALVVTDKLGGPFTPVGFYYRTMIRPRWAWPLYEKFLRNVAGLGKLDKHAGRANRYDVEHRRAEVLVVGGGQAGREAAREHAAAGRQVVLVDEGFVDAARRRGRHLARAGARDLGRRARPRRRGPRPLPLPRREDRRRDGDDRAAARLPGQRPRRRDAPRRSAPADRGLGHQARRAGGRRDRGRGGPRGRRRPAGGRRAAERRLRPPARARPRDRRPRPRRHPPVGRDRRAQALLRPPRHVRGPPAGLLPPRPGGRAGRVRPGARRLHPDRHPGRDRGRRVGRRRGPRRRRTGCVLQRRLGQGQVLRLRLRGRDGQGPEACDRRGLRLHRARQALHHRDDGPLPGPPVPRALDPPLRAREREGRGDDRDHDCAPALGARSRSASSRAGRTSPRSARPSTIATRSSAPR